MGGMGEWHSTCRAPGCLLFSPGHPAAAAWGFPQDFSNPSVFMQDTRQ